METRYYYRRIPEPPKRQSWNPCSKARAEKRQAARGQTEAFFEFVVTLTETYPEIPDKGFVIIREFETEDFETAVSITLAKSLIFGGEEKEYRAGIALDIYENAAGTALAWAMRQ